MAGPTVSSGAPRISAQMLLLLLLFSASPDIPCQYPGGTGDVPSTSSHHTHMQSNTAALKEQEINILTSKENNYTIIQLFFSLKTESVLMGNSGSYYGYNTALAR